MSRPARPKEVALSAEQYGFQLEAFNISTFLEVKTNQDVRNLVHFYEQPLRRFEQWCRVRNRVRVSAGAVMNGITYYFKQYQDQYKTMIKQLRPSLNPFVVQTQVNYILDTLLLRAVRQYALQFFYRESVRGISEWIAERPVDEVLGDQHRATMRNWATDVALVENFLGEEMVESKRRIDETCVLFTVDDTRTAFEPIWETLVEQRRARGLLEHDNHINAAPAAASLRRKRQTAKPRPKSKSKPKQTAKARKSRSKRKAVV